MDKMSKRNIIIAVTAAIAVVIALTVIITVNSKKNSEKTSDPGKISSEYINDKKDITDNSENKNVDTIDVGKDIKREENDLETEKGDNTSIIKGADNSAISSSDRTSTDISNTSDSKNPTSDESNHTDKNKDSMMGWGAWE